MKKKQSKKKDKSKPQNHYLVFSNRVGHSEHAYKIFKSLTLIQTELI